MVEEKKSAQSDGAQKPEERFKELVAIREKEQEVRAKLEAARTQAQHQLQEVEEEIQRKCTQAEEQARAEMERVRVQAIKDAEIEAKRLLETAEAQAKELEVKAAERQAALLDRLKAELLATRS